MATDPVTAKFVEEMVKRSQEKKTETKPQSSFDGVKTDDVVRLTNNLREKIQKGMKQI